MFVVLVIVVSTTLPCLAVGITECWEALSVLLPGLVLGPPPHPGVGALNYHIHGVLFTELRKMGILAWSPDLAGANPIYPTDTDFICLFWKGEA